MAKLHVSSRALALLLFVLTAGAPLHAQEALHRLCMQSSKRIWQTLLIILTG